LHKFIIHKKYNALLSILDNGFETIFPKKPIIEFQHISLNLIILKDNKMNEQTLTEFHKTTSTLIDIINSFTEEQLNSVPNEGWTIGQFGEHLFKSYAFVSVLNGNTKTTTRPMEQKLGPIKNIFSDTTIKMKSPDAIIPSEDKINKAKLVNGLKKRIEQIKKAIQTQDLSLICIDFSIPEYGEFTRYEWIWFNIYHTQRHIQQLQSRFS